MRLAGLSSCDQTPPETTSVSGANRHLDQRRQWRCLRSASGATAVRLPRIPGREVLGERACFQALSPDGRTAAFLEPSDAQSRSARQLTRTRPPQPLPDAVSAWGSTVVDCSPTSI
jgi:hypothetical protein